MQPNAKFIVTLSDPVQRLYSDYFFLDDDRSVVRPSVKPVSVKSASAFHQRALEQVTMMRECIEDSIQGMLSQGLENTGTNASDTGTLGQPMWFRASQM